MWLLELCLVKSLEFKELSLLIGPFIEAIEGCSTLGIDSVYFIRFLDKRHFVDALAEVAFINAFA